MIELTRLNGHSMVVNSDLIKYVESSPDTMLTLIHGEKIVVTEPCEEVVRRITEYRTRLLADVLKQSSGDDLNTLAAASTRGGDFELLRLSLPVTRCPAWTMRPSSVAAETGKSTFGTHLWTRAALQEWY